jgi:hypothetical protein
MSSYDDGGRPWISVLSPDYLTCLHEAAHAITAIHYKIRVTSLAIGNSRCRDRKLRGFCEIISGSASKLAQADTLLAGHLFESMMDPCPWPAKGEMPSDFERAAVLLVSDGADVQAAVPRVKQLVRSLQIWIERLAVALIEHRELDEAEVLRFAAMPRRG